MFASFIIMIMTLWKAAATEMWTRDEPQEYDDNDNNNSNNKI